MIAATDTRWQPLIELLASTGLRISEALALRWKDVDLGSTPSVRVVRAVKVGNGERYGPPKSRSSRRRVPLLTARWRCAYVCGGPRPSGIATTTSCSRSSRGGLMNDANLRRRGS